MYEDDILEELGWIRPGEYLWLPPGYVVRDISYLHEQLVRYPLEDGNDLFFYEGDEAAVFLDTLDVEGQILTLAITATPAGKLDPSKAILSEHPVDEISSIPRVIGFYKGELKGFHLYYPLKYQLKQHSRFLDYYQSTLPRERVSTTLEHLVQGGLEEYDDFLMHDEVELVGLTHSTYDRLLFGPGRICYVPIVPEDGKASIAVAIQKGKDSVFVSGAFVRNFRDREGDDHYVFRAFDDNEFAELIAYDVSHAINLRVRPLLYENHDKGWYVAD
ncbi:hypothetical protein H6504_01530 [Candidatus Woesearchaeota archaeon]|nr:hypothetical protein [Candidatus Woesearchaeota archaeon]